MEPEVWQRGRPHPYDEVLVLQSVVVGVLLVQLPQLLVPVARADRAVERCKLQ